MDMRPFIPRTLPGPRPSTRQEVCLNGEWEFCPIHDETALASDELMKTPPLPSSGWGAIRVPSKWKQVWGDEAADAFGYPCEWSKAHRAWYRRTFTAPESRPGTRLKLQFGGVLVCCEVVVKGQSVGRHLGGVTPFEVDITDAVRPGAENTLALYVVNEDAVYINRPRSRYDHTARAPVYYFYSQSSASLWRDVFLLTRPTVSLDCVAVRTSFRRREIEADVDVRNEGAADVAAGIAPTVGSLDGQGVLTLGSAPADLKAGASTRVHLQKPWPDAHLWSPEDPHLYRLHTKVSAGNALLDEQYERFGFREFWIEGQSFYLNGRKLALFGDWVGYTGALKDGCRRRTATGDAPEDRHRGAPLRGLRVDAGGRWQVDRPRESPEL